ncbi:histidine kinase [candidate division KSB1 bacterium]|nr:MAG: histidine kinase [candidate division KSB1 bacterium]
MEKKKKILLDHFKKYHFEFKHLMVIFVVLVLSHMLITYIHKISLRNFLIESRKRYQHDFINSLANMSATSLELILEISSETKVNDEDARKLVQAFNIVLSQQLLQPHVQEAVLLLESEGKIVPIDDGQHLFRFLFRDEYNQEYSGIHEVAVNMYLEKRDVIRETEQIFTISEGNQIFHIFVPFVLRGEYAGVFYMKAAPSFRFITNEILTSYNQTSLIFTILILFGFLGMFYISSYTISERDKTQRLLFEERENKLREGIIYKKEALFTKRIYHTHHKAEKVMGFIKEDLRRLSEDTFDETKYRIIKYANFISRVIYDMKWYDPPVQTIRNTIFSTNLNEVAKFLVDNLFMRISTESDQFHFKLDLDENLPSIHVNEFVVWEILEPLIQNCIDHSEISKVDIGISTRFIQNKNSILIIIEDNGKGIEDFLLETDENNEQIIFKENISTKLDQKKNGYGCYIAYELAKGRCGWDIKAENKEDGGAKFIITVKNI